MSQEAKPIPSKLWHERFWFRHGVLLVVVSLAAFAMGKLPLFVRFEATAYDTRLSFRPARPIDPRIAFFDIDDDALRTYGRWPWPRSTLAEVLRVLSRAGARSVLFDIELAEPSAPSLAIGLDGRDPIEQLNFLLAERLQAMDRYSSREATALSTREVRALVNRLRNEVSEGLRPALNRLADLRMDHDLILACTALETGRANGVFNLNVAASEQDRQMDRLRYTLFLWARQGAREGRPPPLPPHLVGTDLGNRLAREARLEAYLEDHADARTQEVAEALREPIGWISLVCESRRAEVIRRAVRRVIRRRIGRGQRHSVQHQREGLVARCEAEPGDRPKPSELEGVLDEVVAELGVQRPEFIKTHLEGLQVEALAGETLLQRFGIAIPFEGGGISLLHAPWMMPPLPDLVRSFASYSFSNVQKDRDGVLRNAVLLWEVDGRVIRQPGLTLAMRRLGLPPDGIRLAEGRRLELLNEAGEVVRSIPVDSQGRMLVNWAGRWPSYPHHSIGGLRDALLLEDTYLRALASMDRTGQAEKLSELARQGMPWLTRQGGQAGAGVEATDVEGGPYSILPVERQALELEAAILRDAREGLARLEANMARHAGKTDPRSVARQERRKKVHAERKRTLDGALELRDYLVTRCREIVSFARDRDCFVGASATGLTDLTVMPYQENYPAVGLHGNVLDTILQGRFIARPTWRGEVALIAFLVLLSGVLFSQVSLQLGALLLFALVVTYGYLSLQILVHTGYALPLLVPWISMLINFAFIISIRYLSEYWQRQEAERMFGYYLSPDVIQQLKADPSKLERGGDVVEITSFFTDLAGFSTVSEQLDPDQLFEILNDYLGECTEVMIEEGGTLERYEGDAIRCMFGAPIARGNHAISACRAAVGMNRVVGELSDKYRSLGLPDFKMRLGLNTGEALVGNIGARNRFNFTMQGDSVNLAARLEGINKVYGTAMIIGGATFEKADGGVEARELDWVQVVGRKNIVTIYELIGMEGEIDDETKRIRELYEEGLKLYRERRFEEAIARFEKALAVSESESASKVMIVRCREFLETPPPGDWNGVYVATKK